MTTGWTLAVCSASTETKISCKYLHLFRVFSLCVRLTAILFLRSLHDNDVDIAIYNPDWDELQAHLALALPQYGVKLHYPSEAAGESVFLRVYCALGFADIFGATEIDRERVLVDCGHGDTTAIDSSILLPIGTLEWR